MIREMIGRAPPPLRRAIYECGRMVRTSVFRLPDPFDDLLRIRNVVNPSAILDIGAHEGETVLALRRTLPGVPIHAFEPIPDNFLKLNARVSAIAGVKVHELALGSDIGTVSMFQNANSQTSSLLDNGDDNRRFYPQDSSHAAMIDVPMKTLDSWSADFPDYTSLFIKADVQGAESLLISGGLGTFRTKVDAFYTEISVGDLYQGQADLFSVHELLTQSTPLRLFQLYRTRSNGSGRALWLDAMWVKDEVLAALESKGSPQHT